MNTEQLVSLLETSRRLKTAGFPQDTAFHWITTISEREPDVEPWVSYLDRDGVPALTFAEALALIPFEVRITRGDLPHHPPPGVNPDAYRPTTLHCHGETITHYNAAEAAAQLCLALLAAGHISMPEVNHV